MREDFLHFIFKHKLWTKDFLQLTSGKYFEILDTGTSNNNSGPDFFNAKIKIDNVIWVGNVEIHINSSDWYKHKHDKDLAYNNIILHVVFNNDRQILYPDSEEIPTWEIKFDHILYNSYSKFKNNEQEIPCANYIELIDDINISIIIEKMAIERIIEKTEYTKSLLYDMKNDWEQSFYIALAKNFGFATNSLPFEQLAINTSISIIRKYSDNIFKIEAILFGQSGLLEEFTSDIYAAKLYNEYIYLQKKYNLLPISGELWKKSRLRPANLPFVRIAQFAALLSKFQSLFSVITEDFKLDKIKKYFIIPPSEYWKKHYVFGKIVDKANTKFGSKSFDSIVINTILPFVYLYYKNYKTDSSEMLVLDCYYKIKAENNKEVRAWSFLNLNIDNAFYSQALIHLKKRYCETRKCLDCGIGYQIMKEISNL